MCDQKQELQQALDAVKAEKLAAKDGSDGGFRKPTGVKKAERLVVKIESSMPGCGYCATTMEPSRS